MPSVSVQLLLSDKAELILISPTVVYPLYVLQDEMTEYLRARRLSQAEIEKLYAVENFYEYIQNYLLHHKDVFNYPYQKCADSILYPED